MAVSFTVWNYWGGMLLLTLGPILLFLLISIPLMRFLLRRTKSAGIALLPLLLIVPVLWALFGYVLPAGERTGCLYPPEKAYTHTTAGTVTSIQPADHIPLFYYDGAFQGGVHLTMDGTEYYSLAHPLLTEGTSLHFTYCPEENLVMAFSPIDSGEVAALQAPFVRPEPVPQAQVPQLQSAIGTVCTWVGFLWFGFLALFSNRFALSSTISLIERDSLQRGEVIPDPENRAVSATVLVPFSLIVLGGALSSSAWGLLIPLALGVSLMLLLPRFTACHIRLEGRNIRIRRFAREKTVPLSSLRAVYWSQNNGSFSQRQLVLVFDGWVLHLAQDTHIGLADLHRRLTALLSITQ